MHYEYAIIGAGPAGAFAAELLARGGKSVVLFDGRPEAEQKACGGGVTTKALKIWPQLKNAVGRTIDAVEMISPGGKAIEIRLEEPFAIYSRATFDTFLREQAQDAGATVIPEKLNFNAVSHREKGWRAHLKNKDSVTADFLVAADGANSRFAKEFSGGIPNSQIEVAFGYRTPIPAGMDPKTIVAFLPGWAGYAWAFPRTDHISFGIATSQDAFDHKALDQLLWDFILFFHLRERQQKVKLWKTAEVAESVRAETLEELRNGAERYAARIPGLSPEAWDSRKTAGEDWALLGDAAGFADPVTGEGIYYALRSGELFAQACLFGDVNSYEARWRKDFGGELRRASEMRERFYGQFLGAPFTERMIEFARKHRGIRKVLGQLVAGDQGYVDLKSRLARSALRPF